jgi:N-methylhydantoinase A
LCPEDFDPIVEKIKAERIDAVAVCFLHANVNPIHEIETRRIIQERLPEVSVSLSHEVAREWREYERSSSVVLNAYIAPVAQGYLKSLEAQIAERGVPVRLHVMQSNGGVMTSTAAHRIPIQTLLRRSAHHRRAGVERGADRPNLLCVDMGGTRSTSADR